MLMVVMVLLMKMTLVKIDTLDALDDAITTILTTIVTTKQ